ncbi:hypothetical protein B0J12DRAFT_20065 [Macrophomina phaseolina]|uniref:DUF6594 domain-containing protein n=1 Tax=Macrophomina phaseolina TaxID=35725 RepID=A0ABQ8GUM3_9PEZI|nr:hypothetical protein B0J12DRAFT_20065 [Macrophomina phaseolina]
MSGSQPRHLHLPQHPRQRLCKCQNPALHPRPLLRLLQRITAREPSEASSTDDDVLLPPGYPVLARKMGEMPEVAIFRRFGALNAQNLLYMQAELVCLEKRLHKLQAKDAAAPEPRASYATNWFWLSNSEDQGEGDDDEQWELVKIIREKLKEYSKCSTLFRVCLRLRTSASGFWGWELLIGLRSHADSEARRPDGMLIQQMKLVSVEPPGSWDLRHIQNYLVSEDMDNGVLAGTDAGVWGSEEHDYDKGSSDLLPLASRHNEDIFSSWVTDTVSEKLIRLKQKRRPARKRKLDDFADKKMLRFTFVVSSVLASVLPILSIAILYCVKSLKARLGLIAVFNALLSFALAWFTTAKRAEVFAVSVAFSAVQVVFLQVGTNDTQGVGV